MVAQGVPTLISQLTPGQREALWPLYRSPRSILELYHYHPSPTYLEALLEFSPKRIEWREKAPSWYLPFQFWRFIDAEWLILSPILA
jgi:hypothetical protein